MFGLLNAPRASSLGARAEKRTTLCKSQQGGPHRAEALMPIKVWRPPLRWRDGYIVLNGAELKISEFPDLFDAFGHHFGGQGTTFRLPISGCPPGYESLTSVDAAWRGCFYPAVVGAFGRPAQGYIDVRTGTKTRLRRRRGIRR